MVALPKTVLDQLRRSIYPRKSFTFAEMRDEFAKNGYGPKKVRKWFDYFVSCDIIKEEEDGSLSCIWW